MDAITDDVDGEAQAGKVLLVGMQEFLRLGTMAPWWRGNTPRAATRKIYVSQESTAHDDDDCKAFAAKMSRALGPGSSFELKRLAFEVYDFVQDIIRLKDLAETPEDFGEMFRSLWDIDQKLSGGDMWKKTIHYRDMALTFSKLPLLQCLNLSENENPVGLHHFRFTGGPAKNYVPFHVRMAELLHVLPQELVKSTELAAGQNDVLNGLVGWFGRCFGG